MVCNGQRFADIVIGNQDTDAGTFQVENDFLDFEHLDGIDAGKGLVQQQEMRIDCQRSGNLHPPPLAARQCVTFVMPDLIQTQLLNQLVHPVTANVRIERKRFEDRKQVLFHRKLPEHRGFLRQVTDAPAGALVHGHFCNVRIVQHDAARVRTDQTDNHVERRRLPCAIGSKQSHDLSL